MGKRRVSTESVIAAGGDWTHFDAMDNHYVPNLTIGPLVCQAIRQCTTAPIDVRPMVGTVDCIIADFASAGANIVTPRPEIPEHADRSPHKTPHRVSPPVAAAAGRWTLPLAMR